MQFEWNEDNRETHFLKHGVDFLDVIPMFAGPLLETIDDRFGYGETRINAIGIVGDRVFFVTYTWRGGQSPHHQRQKGGPR
jgi:uncharacterized protein